MNRAAWSLAAAAIGALFYASCGGSVGDQTGDAGSDGTSPSTGGGSGNNPGGGGACGAPGEPCCSDATCESGLTCIAGACLGPSGGTGGNGGGSSGDDGSAAGDDGSVSDGSSGDDSTSGSDAGSVGGGPVDAGYYFGDASFWVDGGPYPADTGTGQQDASTPVIDASPGCAALAACCPTLQPSQQGLCDDVVAQANTADCATELTQLQSEGNCTGATVLASQVQVPPNYIVSDGSTLFWTTAATPGLLAMPVNGGPITILLSGPITNDFGPFSEGTPFLAVDDTNVYILQNEGITRIPKNGSAATLVNESGAAVYAATSLGSSAYWVESAPGGGCGGCLQVSVKSAPLLGGTVASIATGSFPEPDIFVLGVTPNDVFIGFSSLFAFPGNASIATGERCNFLTSDNGAVYCAEASGSNLSIASDGTTSPLGAAVNSSYIVFDDTNVYWADMTTVGTIMKAPKAGGGGATVLASDTNPTAIAVDANSVYWADQSGFIKSIPK